MIKWPFLLILSLCLLFPPQASATEQKLAPEAESAKQWTGVAVSKEGRIFVNYPRWSNDVPLSVAEIKDGKPFPYPNEVWNEWKTGMGGAGLYVCVQSVVFDSENFLWVLDTGNPEMKKVIPGSAKLMKFDLKTDRLAFYHEFMKNEAEGESYLNDVRIDAQAGVAYLTDSGRGAILVLDLKTHRVRRLLNGHPSVMSEGVEIKIGGKTWKRNGKKPDVHADGIALSPDKKYLYYHALTGTHLYRIATEALLDEKLSPQELAKKVETLTETGPADGMEFGRDGNLYITQLNENALLRFDGKKLETFISTPLLSWPDSLAAAASGELFVTTSRIHEGSKPAEPYRIFKIQVK